MPTELCVQDWSGSRGHSSLRGVRKAVHIPGQTSKVSGRWRVNKKVKRSESWGTVWSAGMWQSGEQEAAALTGRGYGRSWHGWRGPWTWWHMKCQRMWGAGPWRPFSTVEGKECKTRTVSCRSWLMLLAEMVSVVLTHAICTHSFIFSPKIFSKFLLYAAHHSTHWRYGDEKTNCPHEVYRLVGKIHTYIPTYIYTHTTHMCV